MYISYYAFGTYVGQKSEGGLCTNMYSGLSVWFLLQSMWMGLFWKTYLLVKQHDNSPTSIIEKPSSWRKRSDKTMAPLPPGYWNCYLISLSALFFQKKNRWELGVPDIQHSIIDHGIQFCTALLQRFKNIHGLNSLVSLVFGLPQAAGGFNPTQLKNHAPRNGCAKGFPQGSESTKPKL